LYQVENTWFEVLAEEESSQGGFLGARERENVIRNYSP
jgi:hypothetical protein